MKRFLLLCGCAFLCTAQKEPFVSHVWVADQGDGTYKNPILFADYSDPDVVRVGEDYYLVASSFDAVPGLPILHSRDLVNWRIAGHVFAEQPPAEVFRNTHHGNGAWAPAIRYHNGEFYVFWPDPDAGIYMAKAKNPAGPWTAPLLVKAAKGWIDPCPLWDDDGRAYLVNAMAASRSAMKSILLVSAMSPDGARLLDDGVVVYDGHAQDPTIEGPKLYKRHGYYYILAPAGGVPAGWQVALRAKNIYGPYERKVVLAQGATAINGPHQGGLVETPAGESWFLHFQDRGVWGRVLHLEPVHWVDDWPVMGKDGAPVLTYRKPNAGRAYPIATPADSDDFNSATLGPQWQWQANPQPGWYAPSPALGTLRLFCVPEPGGARSLWDVPNLLLQKFPAPSFEATAKLRFTGRGEGDRAGIVVMGADYATLAVEQTVDGPRIIPGVAIGADKGGLERLGRSVAAASEWVYLRAKVSPDATVRFSYSLDGRDFESVGEVFRARPGRWIGAKIGLFATRAGMVYEYGSADFDWFQVEPATRAMRFHLETAGPYTDEAGYGFEPGTSPTSKPPFYFSARVPEEGNYKVTVRLGDAKAASDTTVKAELRRLMVDRERLPAGKFAMRTFLVNVRRPQIAGGGEVRLKEREKTTEAWAWDNRITLEFTGSHPAVTAVDIEKDDTVPTLYIVGDSTSTDQPLEPYNSWGQMLTAFFKPEIAVANFGESGESLRSYIGENRLAKLDSVLKPGDWVLIQMGHNDQKEKGEGVGVGAFTTYAADLKRFIAMARQHGATPVLVTSMHRLHFDAGGKIVNTLGDYPEAVRQTAREEDAPLIDLNAMSKQFYEALTPAHAPLAFAGKDTTHHSDYGSYELAKCIVEGIRDDKLPIAKYLIDTPPFDPAHPDPPDRFGVPAEPLGQAMKPYGN